MANERTSLLKPASGSLRAARSSTFDWSYATIALCTIFSILAYILKSIIAFHSSTQNTTVSFLILSGTCRCVVEYLWDDITLSFEFAIYEEVGIVGLSNAEKDAAKKAAQKGTAIPDALTSFLGLVDQTVTSFIAFSKAGCSPLAGGIASVALFVLPLSLQSCLGTQRRISDLLKNRKDARCGDKESSRTYAKHSQTLAKQNFLRRICIVIAFGVLLFFARPEDPSTFLLVLPLVFHTDEKLVKLWKNNANMLSILEYLQPPQLLPEHKHHRDKNTSTSRLLSSQPQTGRAKVATDVSVVSIATRSHLIWRKGAQYRKELVGASARCDG